MFLFTTRGRVCVFPAICPSAVQSTICPARMLLCLAANQNCNQCVHTKNRVPLSSGHLARTVNGRQAGSRRDLHSEASIYLCHNDTLTTSMLYMVAFSHLHIFYYIFILFTYSPSVYSPPPFLALPLRGLFYTLHAQTVAQLTATYTGPWSLIRGFVCLLVGGAVQLLPQRAVPVEHH